MQRGQRKGQLAGQRPIGQGIFAISKYLHAGSLHLCFDGGINNIGIQDAVHGVDAEIKIVCADRSPGRLNTVTVGKVNSGPWYDGRTWDSRRRPASIRVGVKVINAAPVTATTTSPC